MNTLTQDELKGVLQYDPETGVLRWRVSPAGNVPQGGIAGCATGDGYWRVSILGHRYKAHRLIWLLVAGHWPESEIDHINGNATDNRYTNLREAIRAENVRNTRMYRNNTSGFKGVGKKGKTWQAYIRFNGIRQHLGIFDTPEAASAAYEAKAAELFGEFRRNRPPGT